MPNSSQQDKNTSKRARLPRRRAWRPLPIDPLTPNQYAECTSSVDHLPPPQDAQMDETNQTLQTIERMIRERFQKHFGDRYRIDSIVGSSFDRKEREVNYVTVYLAPGGPPLDYRETNDFDILLKRVGHHHRLRLGRHHRGKRPDRICRGLGDTPTQSGADGGSDHVITVRRGTDTIAVISNDGPCCTRTRSRGHRRAPLGTAARDAG